jgi:hypothetical protein
VRGFSLSTLSARTDIMSDKIPEARPKIPALN